MIIKIRVNRLIALTRKKPVRRLAKIVVWALLFWLFFMICSRGIDPDFGWHLTNGHYILVHGFPVNDVFSYVATSHPALPFEWLNDLLVSVVYDFGGYSMLAGLFAALWTLALWLITQKCSLPLVIAGALIFAPFAGTRTQLWAVLFLTILVLIMQSARKNLRWLIPLLTVIWLQFHGSFVVIYAVLSWWILFKSPNKRDKIKIAAILALSLAVSFLNPYGANIWRELFDMITDPNLRWQINEWNPIFLNFPGAVVPFAILFSIAMLWHFGRSTKNHKNISEKTAKNENERSPIEKCRALFHTHRTKLQIFGEPMWPFLIEALSSIRYLPLFFVVSAQKVDEILREILRAVSPWQQLKTAQKIVAVLIAAAIGAIFAYYTWRAIPTNTSVSDSYPAKAAAWLEQNGCPGGNLFNDYGIGGYLIWKAPRVKVFIDGRMPSWRDKNGEKYMDTYARMLNDSEFRNAVFTKYNIRCALIPGRGGHGRKMAIDLLRSGWKVSVGHDNGYLLLVAPAK